MKSLKGNLLIAVTTVITLLLWLFAVPVKPLVSLDWVRHITAGLALNGFFLNFLLATRNKTLEKWFNGLDKLYIYHKYIAISTLGLLLVHALVSQLLKTSDVPTLRATTGDLGIVFVIALIGITLYDKRLSYEKWRLTHKLMLIPYAVGLYHTYISSSIPLTTFSAVSIWVAATSLIGIASAIYIIFFYQRTKFKYKGTVTRIARLSPSVIEWEITLTKPIQFFQGQFIFVKVFQNGIEDAPHPFSISGGDGNKVSMTTKISGDFTGQLHKSLALNTRVAIDGPYGFMDFSHGKKKQLWVAGGIGITPFIAYLREDHPDQEIELYYSFQGAEAGIYKDYISDYQSKNKSFTAKFVDTAVMPFLNFDGYSLQDDTDVYMCGPAKMIEGYAKYFKQNNKNANIVYEAFRLK